jgi:hypothetical protein
MVRASVPAEFHMSDTVPRGNVSHNSGSHFVPRPDVTFEVVSGPTVEGQSVLVQMYIKHRRERDAAAVQSLLTDWVAELETVMDERPAGSSVTTEAQEKWMLESGAFSADELEATRTRLADGSIQKRANQTKARMVKASFSAEEVAEFLGVQKSTVSHRRSDGTLYAFFVGRNPRYPEWQFYGQRPIPHLAEVIAAIPKDTHPTTVNGIMTSPQADLPIDGEPTAPWQWLVEGGAVAPVVDLIDSDNRE